MTGLAAQCTPSHCTWGEVGAMYLSASALAGYLALAVIGVICALVSRRQTRRAGLIAAALLVIAVLIGMLRHYG